MRLGDLIAEAEINLRPMIAAKAEAHALDEQVPAIERQAAGRSQTATEVARIDAPDREQRAIYDAAFERARNSSISARADVTSFQTSASEMGVPLREAEPGSNSRGGSVSQAAHHDLTPGMPSVTGAPSTSRYNTPLAPSGVDLGPRNAAVRSHDPALAAQLAAAEAAIARAREAGALSAADEAELAALDAAAQAWADCFGFGTLPTARPPRWFLSAASAHAAQAAEGEPCAPGPSAARSNASDAPSDVHRPPWRRVNRLDQIEETATIAATAA